MHWCRDCDLDLLEERFIAVSHVLVDSDLELGTVWALEQDRVSRNRRDHPTDPNAAASLKREG